MFDYNVYPNNSPEQFNNACGVIEKAFPTSTKSKLLVDVDGTTIQTYTIDDKDVDIYNDYDIGAVYVKSEIKLDNLF